jgi:hypothetical protein
MSLAAETWHVSPSLIAQFPRATLDQHVCQKDERTLVESDPALLDVVLTKTDEDSVLSSLSSD